MEEKKAKRICFGSSSAREEDIISTLPDSLISEILSYLPTKEAVRTSVLSNRWNSLWLLIPGLDLDSDEFLDYDDFASFIDWCFDFYREENSCLHKLKLRIRKDENEDDEPCVTHWIDFVATRKLKQLDVKCFVKRDWETMLDVMPVSLFICETLLYLRLRQVTFGSFEDSSSVSLPCLKTMRLEVNIYANERSLESFISSCPVLEDLSIVRREDDNVKVLRVCSQTLTSLSIGYCHGTVDNEDDVEILVADDFVYEELGVLIDAPRLKYLNFKDEISHSITITNSGSLNKVNICGQIYLQDSDDHVRKFITSFSGVKDLKTSTLIFWNSKDVVPLPQFCNLSCLEAELTYSNLKMLPTIFASCVNLRSLILDLMKSSTRDETRFLDLPNFLLSSLEFVEIKCNYRRYYPIRELVRYFAENAVILNKLVLRLRLEEGRGENEENRVYLSNRHSFRTRSKTCQIIVCWLSNDDFHN